MRRHQRKFSLTHKLYRVLGAKSEFFRVIRLQCARVGFCLSDGKHGGLSSEASGMTQANMQIALDFSQKLETIRSPFQLVDVIVGFTKRRAEMLVKQSTEMAALTRR